MALKNQAILDNAPQADTTKVDAVICCNTLTDIYNPNIIRSSVGCIFTQQIVVCSKEDCYKFYNKIK